MLGPASAPNSWSFPLRRTVAPGRMVTDEPVTALMLPKVGMTLAADSDSVPSLT